MPRPACCAEPRPGGPAPTAPHAGVAVGDGLEQPLVVAQRGPHRLRLHRIAGVALVAPHRRLVRRPDQLRASRSAGSSARCRIATRWPRGTCGRSAHSATRSSNCSVCMSISACRYGTTSVIRSSRAAHIPAQIGSRCSSASLTSAGRGRARLQHHADHVRGALRGRQVHDRATDVAPAHRDQAVGSPGCGSPRARAGGLTPNSANRLSCDGSTSPSLRRPVRMSSRSRDATSSATRRLTSMRVRWSLDDCSVDGLSLLSCTG